MNIFQTSRRLEHRDGSRRGTDYFLVREEKKLNPNVTRGIIFLGKTIVGVGLVYGLSRVIFGAQTDGVRFPSPAKPTQPLAKR